MRFRIWDSNKRPVQTINSRIVPLLVLPFGYQALPIGQVPSGRIPAPVKTDQELASEISVKLAQIASADSALNK